MKENDHLISLYIDDELDLDDKIAFVETVHGDGDFKAEALDLLIQEKLLRSDVVDHLPEARLPEVRRPRRLRLLKPVAAFAAGLAAAALLLFAVRPPDRPNLQPHRFVIYQPGAERVEITGSFLGWKRAPLIHAGASGYWEITLNLPEGDHRFSYIVEGSRRLPDPTVPVREADDFGGENSILEVRL